MKGRLKEIVGKGGPGSGWKGVPSLSGHRASLKTYSFAKGKREKVRNQWKPELVTRRVNDPYFSTSSSFQLPQGRECRDCFEYIRCRKEYRAFVSESVAFKWSESFSRHFQYSPGIFCDLLTLGIRVRRFSKLEILFQLFLIYFFLRECLRE